MQAHLTIGRRDPRRFALVAKLRPIGAVESEVTEPEAAPKQGREGGPDAWLMFNEEVLDGLADLRVGDWVIVVTWLDLGGSRHPARPPA